MNTQINRLAKSFMAGLCTFSRARGRRGLLFLHLDASADTPRVIAIGTRRATQPDTDTMAARPALNTGDSTGNCPRDPSDPPRDVAA